MEGGIFSDPGWQGRVDEKLRSFDSRIRSNHDRASRVAEKQGKQGELLVEIKGDIKNISDDVAELKSQFKWVLRGLFAAIGVGLLFIVAVANLIIQVAH